MAVIPLLARAAPVRAVIFKRLAALAAWVEGVVAPALSLGLVGLVAHQGQAGLVAVLEAAQPQASQEEAEVLRSASQTVRQERLISPGLRFRGHLQELVAPQTFPVLFLIASLAAAAAEGAVLLAALAVLVVAAGDPLQPRPVSVVSEAEAEGVLPVAGLVVSEAVAA